MVLILARWDFVVNLLRNIVSLGTTNSNKKHSKHLNNLCPAKHIPDSRALNVLALDNCRRVSLNARWGGLQFKPHKKHDDLLSRKVSALWGEEEGRGFCNFVESSIPFAWQREVVVILVDCKSHMFCAQTTGTEVGHMEITDNSRADALERPVVKATLAFTCD